MISKTTLFLCIAIALLSLNAMAQYGPPPRNLQFDSLTLVATWEPPISTVLDEHFEGTDFPPQNWQDTTQGMGWFATTNGSSPSLNIPPHTTYAVVNNSLAGAGNNGCCDYLITPEMDLSQAEGYTLSFNSFFHGLDAETASVEISTDGGTTWMPLLTVLPHFAWANLTADLSSISGPGGAQHVKIAFKANDNGNPGASGWAVDDVVIVSGEMQVDRYGIFLDGTEFSQAGDTAFTFNPEWFSSGFPPYFCIAAAYDSGFSAGVCADFPNYYLSPPTNLVAQIFQGISSESAVLTWQKPLSNQSALTEYYIYRDNVFLGSVPGTDSIFFDLNIVPGSYCYTVSAVYDLTGYGFPGQIGESVLEGPACIQDSVMIFLPFKEDWTAGQFDVNHWNAGTNWVIDPVNGNPSSTAKFSSQPGLTNYSSSLTSYYCWEGWGSSTPNCIDLSFDYLLDDNSASGSENLTVEIWNGETWTEVKEFVNAGNTGWRNEHINITVIAKGKIFRVRFNAKGFNSELINYWLVDNIEISVHYNFSPPSNLTAINAGSNQHNDIQLNWDIPLTEQIVNVIQDDSTFENSLGINAGYKGWLGNKFNAGKGNLRALDIYFTENASSSQDPVFLDVFDANHHLLGSSEGFVPVTGTWQLVEMPNLVLDGDFYAMARFERQPGANVMLGIDSTTNSGRPNTGWYYDGSDWSQMESFGFDECAFSIRAVVKKEVDCENSIIEKSTVRNYASLSNSIDSDKKSAAGTLGLQTFEIYRREYQIPVPEQDSLLTDWQKIATLNTNTYLDQNLAYKCYQYYVEALYDEGSSAPSNTDEACFLVGMDDLKKPGIMIYPNPARDFVTIEVDGRIERITIYNATGAIVTDLPVTIESTQRLNVSGFAPGVYTLRFTTQKGETINRKLVKL